MIISLSGCATMSNPNTFAVCSTLDVASTIVALESGLVEANPLIAGVINSGGYPLLIALNVVVIWLMYRYHQKSKQGSEFPIVIGSGLRCGAAIHNVLLL